MYTDETFVPIVTHNRKEFVMKKVTRYEAFDGKLFENERDCLKYEENVTEQNKINAEIAKIKSEIETSLIQKGFTKNSIGIRLHNPKERGKQECLERLKKFGFSENEGFYLVFVTSEEHFFQSLAIFIIYQAKTVYSTNSVYDCFLYDIEQKCFYKTDETVLKNPCLNDEYCRKRYDFAVSQDEIQKNQTMSQEEICAFITSNFDACETR